MMRFIGLIGFLCILSAVAQADDINSTIRGSGSVVPGSIDSTVRSGNAQPNPMLNSSASNPSSALSTTNMGASNPMLSTTEKAPPSALTTSVDPAFCRQMIKHVPSADTAYQSGVDANGNPVAPADVPGSPQIRLPSRIQIPLTFSLAQTLHLDTSKYPFSTLGSGTEGVLGNLTLEGDKVYFNGQPLSDQQQDNLSVLCLHKN